MDVILDMCVAGDDHYSSLGATRLAGCKIIAPLKRSKIGYDYRPFILRHYHPPSQGAGVVVVFF